MFKANSLQLPTFFLISFSSNKDAVTARFVAESTLNFLIAIKVNLDNEYMLLKFSFLSQKKKSGLLKSIANKKIFSKFLHFCSSAESSQTSFFAVQIDKKKRITFAKARTYDTK